MRAIRRPTRPGSASPRWRSPATSMSPGRKCSPSRASPAPARSCSLMSMAVRERLRTNPWIADATVLKLYPGELQVSIMERQAFALWQKDGQYLGHCRRRHGARALYCAGARAACRSWSAGAPRRRAKAFLALLDRYPADPRSGRARRCWWASGAGTCGCENGLDVRLPEDRRRRARSMRSSRSIATTKLTTRDITAIDLRLPDRVTVRLRRPAAQSRIDAPRTAKDKRPRKAGPGMSSRPPFGLTPKTKPLSPKRSAHDCGARCGHQQDRLPDCAAEAARRRRTRCGGAAIRSR